MIFHKHKFKISATIPPLGSVYFGNTFWNIRWLLDNLTNTQDRLEILENFLTQYLSLCRYSRETNIICWVTMYKRHVAWRSGQIHLSFVLLALFFIHLSFILNALFWILHLLICHFLPSRISIRISFANVLVF